MHETYVRLLRNTEIEWQSRAHFFALAAQTMRRILVDYARARGSERRGGGVLLLPLDEALVFSPERCEELLALDGALGKLAQLEKRVSDVIEQRFFGGMSYEEIAAVLSISVRTAKRDWEFGRAWLQTELESESQGDA